MTPLMTAKEVGQFLRMSARHVLEKVSKTPGFPKPIRFPTTSGTVGYPRWKQEEVKAWVDKLKP